MKKEFVELIICPACLPQEIPVKSDIQEVEKNEILYGRLFCPRCRCHYPIEEGIAELLPRSAITLSRSQQQYENMSLVSSYLWSHYGDLIKDPHASDTYQKWASILMPDEKVSSSVDVGCAAGRISFEMSTRCDFAVGIDLSRQFIRAARQLAKNRTLDFELVHEGRLTQTQTITLPPTICCDRVEFLVADALALPFPKSVFPLISSLNILDKVSQPLKLLQEVNRVARDQDAHFLFSDPYSWSSDSAPEELWLGGTVAGPYPGSGRDNVLALLQGKDTILVPPWKIEGNGALWWKIRNHQNHYELIRSEYILASR